MLIATVNESPANPPTSVFCVPVVTAAPALLPTAVLYESVLEAWLCVNKAPLPIAVLWSERMLVVNVPLPIPTLESAVVVASPD